ncbi:MAG: hypothetical protein ACE5OZ_22545 [Candidatus Heimdallarchaeota archaeon]
MHIRTRTSRSERSVDALSSQPEFFLFLTSFRNRWLTPDELKKEYTFEEIQLPFSLGNAVFKFETNGFRGEIISFALAFNNNLHVAQLCDPDGVIDFYRHCVDQITRLATSEAPLFYSYDIKFVRRAIDRLSEVSETPALRNLRKACRDLSKIERKAFLLRNIPDIAASEVPQYWATNCSLCALQKNRTTSREIIEMRTTILDALAKHAALECSRISAIFMRDLIMNFDRLGFRTEIPREKQYEFFADSMRGLGDFQTAAFWYSKLLASETPSTNMEHYIAQLEHCISEMKPDELIQYAVHAAQVAKRDSAMR